MTPQELIELSADLSLYTQSRPLRSEDVEDTVYARVLSNLESRASTLLLDYAQSLPSDSSVGRDVRFAFIYRERRTLERPEALVVHRRSGGHWIAVNVEILSGLSRALSQLWSHQDFLPQLDGGAEALRGRVGLFSHLGAESQGEGRRAITSDGTSTVALIQIPTPRSPFRCAALETCYEMAFDLLISHAYSHVIARHLEMRHGNMPEGGFSEGVFRLKGVGTPDAQAMELEADIFASTMLLERVQTGEFRSEFSTEALPTPLLVSFWAVSLWFLFWLLNGNSAPMLSQSGSLTHPHPIVRTKALIGFLSRLTVAGGTHSLLDVEIFDLTMARLWDFLTRFEETMCDSVFDFDSPAGGALVAKEIQGLYRGLGVLFLTRKQKGLVRYSRAQR